MLHQKYIVKQTNVVSCTHLLVSALFRNVEQSKKIWAPDLRSPAKSNQ